MAFTDHWEVDSQLGSEIWPLMVGKTTEDAAETESQISIILNTPPVIPSGNRVLEIGAGVGRLVRAMASTGRFNDVHGVDSSMSIAAASQLYLEGHRATITLTDGINLPYPSDYFDFIYSFTCFQHMISLAIIHRNLCEIRRTLTLGGICRVQTIRSGQYDPRDLKQYDGRVFSTADDFADQFRAAGLDVIKVDNGLTHPEHIWVTGRKVQ